MCIILCISIQYYTLCQTLTAWNTSNFQENGSLTLSEPLLGFAASLKCLSCLCTLQKVDSAHKSQNCFSVQYMSLCNNYGFLQTDTVKQCQTICELCVHSQKANLLHLERLEMQVSVLLLSEVANKFPRKQIQICQFKRSPGSYYQPDWGFIQHKCQKQ